MLSVPSKLLMPPPRVAAVLPEIVELVIDEVWPRLLLKLKMPPPPLDDAGRRVAADRAVDDGERAGKVGDAAAVVGLIAVDPRSAKPSGLRG